MLLPWGRLALNDAIYPHTGGAALTRAYVEEDCAAAYESGGVAYARDAFDGLSLMAKVAESDARRSARMLSRRPPAATAEPGAPASKRAARRARKAGANSAPAPSAPDGIARCPVMNGSVDAPPAAVAPAAIFCHDSGAVWSQPQMFAPSAGADAWGAQA